MLYVYFGNDVNQVRQKAFDFVHTLIQDETNLLRITPDVYEEGMLTDIARASSLFGGEQVCLIDSLGDDADHFENLMTILPSLKSSGNHFILIESALNAAGKKALTTHATYIEELTAVKTEKFNTFTLTDALLRRDKKSLWLLLIEAWKNGIPNEEIVGILFWQIKILRLVEKTKSAEEAGQKPFVYSKAKRALSNFKAGEIDALSRSIVGLYHDGHLGKRDMANALEQWVLTL